MDHYRAFASTIMPTVAPRQGYIAVHIRGTDKGGSYANCLSETLLQFITTTMCVLYLFCRCIYRTTTAPTTCTHPWAADAAQAALA